jgi:hypothetical protein
MAVCRYSVFCDIDPLYEGCIDTVVIDEEKIIFFIFTWLLNRLELPKDRTVGVKADEAKNIEEVLEPILRQYGLDINEYDICLVSKYYRIVRWLYTLWNGYELTRFSTS